MTRAVLIPAAGASSRMRGRDKLMEVVHGQPMLRRVTERALATGAKVIVVLPPGASTRRDCLIDLPVTALDGAAAHLGMSASIRLGVAKAVTAHGLMILPADMPDLTVADLRAVWRAFEDQGRETIMRGASEGAQPGHPVIFPANYFPDLQDISGDLGARAVIARHGASLCPLPGQHALTDLDTPEDWAAWRVSQGKK